MVQRCKNHWKTIIGNGGLKKKTLTIPSLWKIDHHRGLSSNNYQARHQKHFTTRKLKIRHCSSQRIYKKDFFSSRKNLLHRGLFFIQNKYQGCFPPRKNILHRCLLGDGEGTAGGGRLLAWKSLERGGWLARSRRERSASAFFSMTRAFFPWPGPFFCCSWRMGDGVGLA